MQPLSFSKVAIINRGEPAVRFLRALQEFNLIHNTTIKGVALYTEPDERAPFVRQADESICLDQVMRQQPDGSLLNAYCDHQYLIELLIQNQCDAVWPGWGFVSEDPIFVKLLEENNITFLGPSSTAMSQLGDKIAAKYLAESSNVPLAPWCEYHPNWPVERTIEEGNRIGYPLMVKASAGGGGRGIRKVHSSDDLLKTIETVQQEVSKFFGQGGILLEKCVSSARHIEVQLVCTPSKAYAVGVRDCSIQRKNQKVIEEAPSPILPKSVQQILFQSSEKLAESCGYVGVATAEFLYEPHTELCTFLEVNSRLQVEHTITEAIMGIDLVQAQISIALGWQWEAPTHAPNGHAIELRVNAEDPEQDFRPAPGRVAIFRPPSGPGVRVDSGITEGSTIPEFFDSMIAKLIIWAPTRELCIARARRACLELDAAVEDGATNQAFLLDILRHEEFVQATAATDWLDRAMQEGSVVRVAAEKEALLAAAILEYKRHTRSNIDRFFQQAQEGIPFQFPENRGFETELRLRGISYSMLVASWGQDEFVIEVDSQLHRVQFRDAGAHIAEIWVENTRHKILYSFGSAGITVELDGYSHTVERSSGGIVKSPTPAVIVGISVQAGDFVEVGDKVCTLEAMKMETAVYATETGRVKEVLCQVNQQVLIGDALLVLELEESEDSIDAQYFPPPQAPLFDGLWQDGTIDLSLLDVLPQEQKSNVIDEICALVRASLLGFDGTPKMKTLLDDIFRSYTTLAESTTSILCAPLVQCLSMFSDTTRLLDRNVSLDVDDITAMPANIAFYEYCRQHHNEEASSYIEPLLLNALKWYQIDSLKSDDWLRESLFRLALAHNTAEWRHHITSGLLRFFMRLHQTDWQPTSDFDAILENVGQSALSDHPHVRDNAIQAHHLFFTRTHDREQQEELHSAINQMFDSMMEYKPDSKVVRSVMRKLGRSPQALQHTLHQMQSHYPSLLHRILEALTRRVYVDETYQWLGDHLVSNIPVIAGSLNDSLQVVSVYLPPETSDRILQTLFEALIDPIDYLEIILPLHTPSETVDQYLHHLGLMVTQPKRITVSWLDDHGAERHFTLHNGAAGWTQDALLVDIHPQAASRLHLERLADFDLTRIYTHEHIYAFLGQAKTNPKDERIFVLAEVFGSASQSGRLPLRHFERAFFEAIRAIRHMQSRRTKRSRLQWNWLFFHIHPKLDTTEDELTLFSKHLEPYTRGLNLREVQIHVRTKARRFEWSTIQLRRSGNHRLELNWVDSHSTIAPLTPYEMKVIRAQKFGHTYPYEIISMLEGSPGTINLPHHDMKQGRFQEYDFLPNGQFAPVLRSFGQNICGVVVGIINNATAKHPHGMQRVWIGSDSTKAMGSLAEKECSRIIAAINLAESLNIPIEWVPVSAGAMISMNSGTENLDWTAKVLKRIIEFTQNDGIIHLIVHGINVGAQSYWNAESTMLMHTKGVLIMTPEASMVLTGKKALDFSGGVSAEDERGIGGFERIMGPNGQAQFRATDLGDAYRILFEVYHHTYHLHGQTVPTQATSDSSVRNICLYPYHNANSDFQRIGEIFSTDHNRERKKPFAIRPVMQSLIDQDSTPLERYTNLYQGESSVVWYAHIGGVAVTLLGIESQAILRRGRIPTDGPDTWTGGTLFPQSSKKISRAINAASGIHPIVVLANLSGFDGSPESLRLLQLEYGAEIGRAVVNCASPIIFVVIGRYHGGAYVVFSKDLNPKITALAVEGSYASVIGGAPAAAVVFPRDVRNLVEQDKELQRLRSEFQQAPMRQRPLLEEQIQKLITKLTLEKRGDVATQFDGIHTVERAIEVGSLDDIIPASSLRERVIQELHRTSET